MATKSKKTPSPEELLAEVKGQKAAKTYEFEDYIKVIDELEIKGHSYSRIAKLVTERLGISASRGQIYRALQMYREAQAEAKYAQPQEPEDPYERETGYGAVDVLKFLLKKYPEKNSPTTHRDILRRALDLVEIKERDEREAVEADTQREQKKTEKKTNELQK